MQNGLQKDEGGGRCSGFRVPGSGRRTVAASSTQSQSVAPIFIFSNMNEHESEGIWGRGWNPPSSHQAGSRDVRHLIRRRPAAGTMAGQAPALSPIEAERGSGGASPSAVGFRLSINHQLSTINQTCRSRWVKPKFFFANNELMRMNTKRIVKNVKRAKSLHRQAKVPVAPFRLRSLGTTADKPGLNLLFGTDTPGSHPGLPAYGPFAFIRFRRNKPALLRKTPKNPGKSNPPSFPPGGTMAGRPNQTPLRCATRGRPIFFNRR
jgi:hypothetical protein